MVEDPATLEAQWTSLEERASCSFFQSWGWIGTWLASLPRHLRPLLFEVRLDDRVVGLCLLGRNTVRRHGVIVSKGLFLSETGDSRFDCLTVEHNGFLVDRELRDEIVSAAVCELATLGLAWDELFLNGVARKDAQAYVQAAQRCGAVLLHKVGKMHHYVDCAAVRESGLDYLQALSSNTRYQVRRAIRMYAERGPIEIDVARTVNEAQDCFETLRTLHQRYWIGKGQCGAFATDFATRFHRTLIASRFGRGEIQLMRVRAGTAPIGYLYNFVFRGVVSNYQSGFMYESDTRLKPGLVSHVHAVQRNIADGAETYDLLAGDQRYKLSLATGHGEMAWLVLQKRKMRFRMENFAARCRTQMRIIGQRSPRSDAAVAAE